MRKFVFLLLISLLFFSSCKMSTREQVLNKKMKHVLEDNETYYSVSEIIPINFSNSGNNEFFVYFDCISKETHEKSKSKRGAICIFDKKNNLLFFELVSFPYMRYDDGSFFQCKIDGIPRINEGMIYDLNGNGKDEFILITICGSSFEFDIFEYRNGKLELICADDIYDYNLISIDFEAKSLYLMERNGSKNIELQWNPSKEFYEKKLF